MCERQEICKEEKVWGTQAVYVVCATSSYVVVITSRIKYLMVLRTILAIFADLIQ